MMRARRRFALALPGAIAFLLSAFPGAHAAAALQEAPAVARPEEAWTIPLDAAVPVSPDVIVGQLDNGLTYYIRENREPQNRAEIRLIVKVGATVEDEDQIGLAHFLEHMAFNGTENFEKQELVRFMESIGMRLGPGVNAATSVDDTDYRLTLPMDNPTYLPTAFRIVRDWMDGLTLDPEEIDRERGVVIEEWRSRQGAATRVREKQAPFVFRNSRYADRNIIGTPEGLASFEHAALRRFYEDWYRPDLMGVIVVGDFDGEEVEALLRETLSAVPAAEDPRERPEFDIPAHPETLFSIITDPELTRTQVAVYHKMEAERDWTVGGYRDRIVEWLYNSMLNERFAEIARTPDAPFLGASSGQGMLVPTKDVYALSAAVPDRGAERGLEALFREAERVERFGFTESELERAKTNILRTIEQIYVNRGTTTSTSFADEYKRAFLEGESIPGIEYEWELYKRFVPGITLEEVNQVGRRWIREEDRVVLLTAPEREAATLPDADRLAAVIREARLAEITAYEDRVLGEGLMDAPPAGTPVVETVTYPQEITEWRLGNGVRVVLKPTDFEEDQILMRAFSPGGTSMADDEILIPALTAESLVGGSGLGEYDAISLGRLLTGKVVNAAPVFGEFEEGVTGSSSVQDLETLFQLIYLTFTEPRADEEFLQVWLNRARTSLANRDANPEVAFGDAYTRLLTSDHPRDRPITLASLDAVDLDRSFAFYRDRFADASDFTFVFVGSIDLETMRPLVEQYLGGLPSTGRAESWRDHGARPMRGVVEEIVRKGLEPSAQTVLFFTGPFDSADQRLRTGYRALAQALESRLMDRVREELGGTYGVGVGPSYEWRPEDMYLLSIYFGSDPGRVDELLAVIYEVIEEFRQAGPTASELSDAQETLLRNFEVDFRENASWLNQLVNDYQRDVLPPGRAVETFEEVVRTLTIEELRDLARSVLDRENVLRVTLLPE